MAFWVAICSFTCVVDFFADGGHDVMAWNAPRNLLIIVHNVAPTQSLENTLTGLC